MRVGVGGPRVGFGGPQGERHPRVVVPARVQDGGAAGVRLHVGLHCELDRPLSRFDAYTFRSLMTILLIVAVLTPAHDPPHCQDDEIAFNPMEPRLQAMTFDWDEFKTMKMVMGKSQDIDTLQLVFGTNGGGAKIHDARVRRCEGRTAYRP